MKYVEMEEEKSSNVDESVSKRETGAGVNSNPASPKVRTAVTPSPPSHDSKEESTSKESQSESRPRTAQAEPQTENGGEDSGSLNPLKGSISVRRLLPQPKRNPKKTLNELHQQLLKKLDPSLVPSSSTTLPEIFSNGFASDPSKPTENNSSSAQKQPSDTANVDSKNALSPSRPEEPTNGSWKNPAPPDGRPSEKGGLYRCSVGDCTSSFNRINDLKAHFSSAHPGLDSFPCSFCFEGSESLESMTEHLKAHIKNVFKCSHCQMASDTKEELLNHIAVQHPGQPKKITIYVKILNNDRQKKVVASAKAADAPSETKTDNSPSLIDDKLGSTVENAASGDSPSIDKTVVSPSFDKTGGVSLSIDKEPTEVATTSLAKPVTTELTKSRSSRKSTKPVKVQKDPADDLIRILPAERSMTVTCDRCSFTCDLDLQLKSHGLSGHASPNGSGLFRCKVCKMSTDTKSVFKQHMAHHTGRHIIRYYICPYCKIDTTSMDMVEEHVGDKHPSEAFRFEVLQETIEFLQDLLECPVCKGSFMWKDDFLNHVTTVHRLDDLAEHLRDHFPAMFPGTASVPKSLLRNLLPETTDFEDLPTIVSSDDEGPGVVGIEGKDPSAGETLSICVQQSSTKDGEKILQFHCETCNYVAYEYEKYTAHLKTHSIDKSESLIKKLLTKPTGPDETSAAPAPGLEAPLQSATAILLSNVPAQRTGGLFHCHLCPFQCSKTVHFKRHLAIHARNETLTEGYKCGYCQFAHYRLNCVKFHLGKYHGDLPHKMIRIADGIEIELGADDDPGRVKKSPSRAHSTPFLRTASEKRPTARYEESLVPNLPPRSLASGSRGSPIASDRSQDVSLTEFELQLPPSMIYREPLKCPKCDFTNRVRVNLQRHLKLHREEANEEIMEDSSELRRLMLEEVPLRTKVATGTVVKREEPVAMMTTTNKRSQVLDEKPLLRSILCEKPAQVAKSEPEMDESDLSTNDSPLEDPDPSTMPHANVSKDYSDFSIRLPKTDQYQCKECAFVHRYPSKVKRHYYYKHITVCPYKCGYCTFEGVEIGKVKRHCQQMHRDQPELVLKRDVFATASTSSSANVDVSSTNDCGDVEIIDETISRDKGDGQGDRWLPQFVIKVDNSLQCCRLCGYQPEGSMSLKRHVYTKHLKFYPFSCSYCGVALMEIYRVKRHIEKYHAGMPFVVVRRRFEDMTKDEGELPVVHPGKTSAGKVYVKMEAEEEEEEEVEEVEEEAPQLDFYPKAESDDAGGLSDSTGWKEDGREDSVEGDPVDGSGDNTVDSSARDRTGMEVDELEAFSGANHRRLFKCVYCGIISKWNRRDIRLHIMHVHMRRRVYTCRHCSFGNSKSKAVVRNHCAKFHPHKPVSVRDDLALFNAVIPIEDKNGIVTMAFSDRKGVPLLDIEDLDDGPKPKVKVDPPKPPVLVPSRTAAVERDALEVDEESEERRNTPASSSRRNRSSSGVSSRSVSGSRPSRRKVENREEPKALVKSEVSGNVKEKSEWRCKLCGFVNQNASHVKYHLICYHMKLKPFSCPYCHLYIWKSQGVISHIEKHHPGREKKIYATVEEKATYLCSKIEKVLHGAVVERKPEVEKPTATDAAENSTPSQKISYFRCGLCGYQDVRNDKTKYHIIKQHLQLRQFSCPHCHLYMWGRQQVMKHCEEEHPGMEVSVTRTFQEYEDYLKQNITKVSGPASSESQSEDEPEDTTSTDQRGSTLVSPAPSLLCLRCNKCSFVTDSEMSLSAHKRSHRMFQCYHCDFQHMLAAKVQIHCLTKHPNKLVKYRQCDTSTQMSAPQDTPTTRVARSAPSSSRSDRSNDNSSSEQSGSKVFHPCDVCPAHFNTASELERHLSHEHHGMYICNYCHIVMWDSASMREHLGQSHPNRPPEFRVIKKEPTEAGSSSTRKRSRTTDASDVDSEDSPRKMPKLEPSDPSDFQLSETLTPVSGPNVSHDYVSAIYKCRLCNYKSGKVTVMRHHAMSHLRYHPYLCPYCDLVRSVKSFPITKHVRSKHPDREQRFIYARNEDLEKQVKDSYYRAKPSDVVEPRETAVVEEPEEREAVDEEPAPVESISMVPSTLPRKVLYKCTFCSLKTHIRTDMKHHLMREIQYKPYRCMYCTYTEPCKWSMRKHFRTKHGGIEVEVEDMRDPENDARVEKLLEKCTVLLKHTVDPELLSWKPSPTTPQRRVQHPQAVPTESKTVAPKPSFGVSLLRRSFKGSKSMAMKFHRCPHCPYTNTSVKLVRGHMVKHGPFRLQCGYCDYRGHYPSRIRKHMRRHHPAMPFKYSKVALPPKDQKAEQIPVIHVPRSQVRTQNKPAPGQSH